MVSRESSRMEVWMAGRMWARIRPAAGPRSTGEWRVMGRMGVEREIVGGEKVVGAA